jgi:hypothetical protein
MLKHVNVGTHSHLWQVSVRSLIKGAFERARRERKPFVGDCSVCQLQSHFATNLSLSEASAECFVQKKLVAVFCHLYFSRSFFCTYVLFPPFLFCSHKVPMFDNLGPML